MTRNYLSHGALRLVTQFAAKYLGSKVAQRAIGTKSMPIVSSAIGAAWNFLPPGARYFEMPSLAVALDGHRT